MLKKLIAATGIVGAGMTGAMVFGGPANADVPSARHRVVPAVQGCYNAEPGGYRLDWCRRSYPERRHGPHQGHHHGRYRATGHHDHHHHGWHRADPFGHH